MKNCLILLTNSYPYSLDEPFIESEMPFLAKQFDKVITLAIGLGKDAPKTRQTPDNVDCYNIAKTSKSVSRIISFAKGAVKALLPAGNIEAEAKKSIKNRAFYEYFCARSEREYLPCKEIIERYDFSEYDSVTIFSYWFFVTAMVASKIYDQIAPQCKKIRFVSRAHGYDVYKYANSLGYLPMREYLLSRVDMLYPCSKNGEDYIAEQYPEYRDKIQKRYLGTFDCGLNRMNDDCFHVVSCSRMVELKRIDRIASALSLLENEDLGTIKWTHIGDGETMEIVKTVIANKLNFMQVDMIGNTSNKGVLDFYKSCKVDLLVNVSTTEGLPVSMMEAMSFSIPVLATSVGGVGEIVRDGYNGMLIPADFTDEDLALKIKEFILSSKEEKETLRKNARSFWEENFNADENYAQFAAEICG